jgi:alpha-glucosidase
VIYQDGENAHWKENPTDYEIHTQKFTSEDQLSLKLAPGGGAAVKFKLVK